MARRPPTAASLLVNAAGHIAAAQALRDADPTNPDNGTFSASMWFLMGWGAEEAFKSVSLFYGATDRDIRAIGHDLPAALGDARARGFASTLRNLDNMARDLAITHEAYYFRYMHEGDTWVPGDSQLTLAVLKALIYEIGELLGWGPAPPGFR